jgi:hypothetical protein
MGFPTDMFTVLFALGRLPGWIAQWREMVSDPTTKIGRPRQIYTGDTERGSRWRWWWRGWTGRGTRRRRRWSRRCRPARG